MVLCSISSVLSPARLCRLDSFLLLQWVQPHSYSLARLRNHPSPNPMSQIYRDQLGLGIPMSGGSFPICNPNRLSWKREKPPPCCSLFSSSLHLCGSCFWAGPIGGLLGNVVKYYPTSLPLIPAWSLLVFQPAWEQGHKLWIIFVFFNNSSALMALVWKYICF